jgi:hypothetical protein
VFQSDYKPRALIATYQNLGLIKNNVLTIISPKQEVKQLQLTLLPNQKTAADFNLLRSKTNTKRAN